MNDMMSHGKKYALILIGLAIVAGVILASQAQKQAESAGSVRKTGGAAATPAQPAASTGTATKPLLNDAALRQKVINYVRERFGLARSVTITADPFKPSVHPNFLETTIYTEDGKKKSSTSAYVTQDQKSLALGRLVAVKSDPKAELITSLRQQFRLPATTSVVATDFAPSSYPDLLVTTVTVSEGAKPAETQELFMTRDRRALVVGAIFSLGVDLRKNALRTISLANHPRLGPSTAPVTIVEYSDLQCPTCARMHDFIENDIAKKYSGKVQVIFKEFPLPNIHDWTLTGSIANQCAYQINPSTYVPFRSMIFKNQLGTTAGNARELMLSYGDQLGIDRLRLAGCIDSKASLARVEADFTEGKNIGVQSTPTTFINGRMVVGMPDIEAFHKEIDDALRTRK